MILFSQFGYATRHSMRYNPKSKPGRVRLWCSYNGSSLFVPADPIKNGESGMSELFARESMRSPAFGSNVFVDFSIGSDEDVFSVLTAIMFAKQGREYAFKNFAGRKITFSRTTTGNGNRDVVHVSISHKTDVGELTLQEMDEFEEVARNILVNVGYSKQQITETTQLLMSQASLQSEESSTSENPF